MFSHFQPPLPLQQNVSTAVSVVKQPTGKKDRLAGKKVLEQGGRTLTRKRWRQEICS